MTTSLPLAPLHPGGSVLGDEVYAVLGAAIRDGVLAPGQRLRDMEVARSLGVSRTPVREALQRLERIGLVEVSANRYTRVSEHDLPLHGETLVYLAYAMGIGLRMSLAHSTPTELTDQLACVDAMIAASASDDRRALAEASALLYELVTKTSGNRVFLRMMRESGPFFLRSVESWEPHLTDVDLRTTSFVALREAMAARDGDGAERIVRHQHGID